MKKVLIGGPVRNRGWILERHLDALKKMEIPPDIQVEYCYLVNDSTDETQAILDRHAIPYVLYDTHHGSGAVRGQYSYENLAQLRNAYLQIALEREADYLLSIDSDILVPVHALKQLLDDNCDIVSMLLCNQPLPITAKRAHNVMREGASGIMYHIFDFPMDSLFSVDLTGACYLIQRKVLEAGVRYAQDRQGEDIPFCREAKQKGFGIYCDSRVRPIHVMYPGQEIEAGRME